MNQSGRLQSVIAAFVPQLAGCNLTQVVIDEGNQFISRLRIAQLETRQLKGNIARRAPRDALFF